MTHSNEIDAALQAHVTEVWHANGRLDSTIRVYLRWVRAFHREGPATNAALTRIDVERFARSYVERRGLRPGAVLAARVALRAWARACTLVGESIPEWEPRRATTLPPLLAEFQEFRLRHAGVATTTACGDVKVLGDFHQRVLRFVAVGGEEGAQVALDLAQIDDYVTECCGRWSRRTVARFCCSLRAFLRFLHFRGYLHEDLAWQVSSPVVRQLDRPPRALAWRDVQRLVDAVDLGRRRTGHRDRALLLMMAMYGMGAAEVLHLKLKDVDWRAQSIRAFRPKTQMEYFLPLLPSVAKALATYLREARPRRATTRHIFVSAMAPHGPMTGSAVRFAVRKYAEAAGLTEIPVCGHTLRHSHARRQFELGTPLKTISDILGHRSTNSTTVYVRVATTQLRSLALPVPR